MAPQQHRLRHMRHAFACARLCTHLKHQRRAKKSMPCLIKKALRCAADHTSKTTFFLSPTFYKIQRYTFSTQRTTDFNKLKRNMDDGTIVFLASLLIPLTWKFLLLSSFWYKIISCFKKRVYSFLSTLAIK